MRIGKTTSALTLIFLISTSIASGQNTPIKTDMNGSGQPTASRSSDVSIGSGDLLEISVAGAPEYHYDMRVSSTGEVSLPMIGNIKVAGLSTVQAEKLVAQGLQEHGFFNNPQVSVFVKEYATVGISVLGEVQKPGIYPLLGHRSLLEAISAAGGVTAKAGRTATIRHRGAQENSETVILSNDQGRTMNDGKISPGDTVVVSKAGIVYVVGDVKEPTGIVMENPRMTVLQAVAMAHGTNPTASLKSARLIRKAGAGAPQEIPVPLDTILSAKMPDLELQPDDILFVPNSVAKTLTRRGLEAVIQTAVGLAIYRPY